MPLSPPRRQLFIGRFHGYRFFGLLLALLILLLASPFVGTDPLDRVILSLLLALVLFAAVGAASTARHERWVASALATASFMVFVAGSLLEHRLIYLPALALFTLYLAYTIAVVLRRLMTTTQIDADILCGAAAIYLLIGVAWAMTYYIIYALDKDAFTAVAALHVPPYSIHEFMYYSLSTLTTLGMGDITPVNRFAQIWTMLESITANLYLALLVARLVSLYR
jgi:voltage-gated potassium channel